MELIEKLLDQVMLLTQQLIEVYTAESKSSANLS
jgi:hypothetical protein